jgi:hypothetical protein
VKRSQTHFFQERGERPIQLVSYISFENILQAVATIFGAILFGIMAKLPFTRDILANVKLKTSNTSISLSPKLLFPGRPFSRRVMDYGHW